MHSKVSWSVVVAAMMSVLIVDAAGAHQPERERSSRLAQIELDINDAASVSARRIFDARLDLVRSATSPYEQPRFADPRSFIQQQTGGRTVLTSVVIGGLAGGILGGFAGATLARGLCDQPRGECGSTTRRVVAGSGVGLLVGAGIGYLVGVTLSDSRF